MAAPTIYCNDFCDSDSKESRRCELLRVGEYFAANPEEFTGTSALGLDSHKFYIRPLDRFRENLVSIAGGDLFRSLINGAAPSNGAAVSQVFKSHIPEIRRLSVDVQSPNYMGHMTGALPSFAPFIDRVIGELNQNVVKIETASIATVIERQVLGWLHNLVYQRSSEFYTQMLYNDKTALGNITSGGTIGNLTGLAVAREQALPGAAEYGLVEALSRNGYADAVVFASSRVHYSVGKITSLLGIGSRGVIEIPVDPKTHKIDCAKLRSELVGENKRYRRVIAIIGIAGATETGSIDDLQALAEIAQEFGIWFHVDAAWGGCLLLSESQREKLRGIEFADSVVIDAHKGMYVSMSCGSVLFRNERSLDSLRHNARYIVREGSFDLGQTGVEGSRRFDALKIWLTWNIFGNSGYSVLIESMVERAGVFAELVAGIKEFEITSPPEAGILTYRFNPSGVIGLKDERRVEVLNRLNERIHERLPQESGFFVSRTSLETVDGVLGKSSVVLRVVFLNPLINSQCMQECLQAQLVIGMDELRSCLGSGDVS
jgi:putative pyridoxal-dependent aspartate 1-decarboxylase